MLSAFKAQLLVEFKQRDKSKLESILAYGRYIYDILGPGILYTDNLLGGGFFR